MSSTDYEFRTVWRVAGTPEEIVAVLGDATTLPEWWPSVYLSMKPLHRGRDGGVGGMARLHTKGWLFRQPPVGDGAGPGKPHP